MRGVSNHMKKKKAIAKMILLAFILSIVLPAGAFAEGTTASDISGHWAESTITSWMDAVSYTHLQTADIKAAGSAAMR